MNKKKNIDKYQNKLKGRISKDFIFLFLLFRQVKEWQISTNVFLNLDYLLKSDEKRH